ncbi:thymidylate synthase [Corynebacterium sp. TA-R-1]|uniref:Thymidylate synthase n=1 Tax=Corynebacterium stercoris TaxID=2943490 RepID=A0ABT1G312_9CORY|nr:thymidylate synthase [Corynebacterium stercoris]
MAIPTPYEDLLRDVLKNGTPKGDRTGTGTRSVFGRQIRYNLEDSFPLLTTKKVYFKGVAGELLWFLRGESNVRWLQENGIRIWNEWADADGELGPVYGVQWRSWPTPDGAHIDQIAQAVRTLTENPDSRRNLVSAWNVAELDKMALMPCHLLFQLYVADGRLSMQVYQRSADMFLGVPFNIASYALLTHMFAQQADLEVGELIWTGGDCHIYNDHIEQVREQLSRDARPYPQLKLCKADSIFDYTFEDIEVVGYDPHPTITAKVSV